MLENVSHRFTKPNILDIKLGTVLYDDHATEEKKQRMIRSAKETTSLETGVRITGFQVSDPERNITKKNQKPPPLHPATHLCISPNCGSYACLETHLPTPPCISSPISLTPTSSDPHVDMNGFGQVYDSTTDESIQTGKPYGRALTASRLPEAMARFFPIRRPFAQLGAPNPVSEGGQELADGTRSPAGTKPELLLPVLQGVLSAVKEIEEAVRRTSMRMVGGSILVIYEGEENALQTALAHLDQREETGPAYAVKVIDFAHTKLEEGLGPDEGVLFGLKTTIGLLQGRIQEVQEAMASTENVA